MYNSIHCGCAHTCLVRFTQLNMTWVPVQKVCSTLKIHTQKGMLTQWQPQCLTTSPGETVVTTVVSATDNRPESETSSKNKDIWSRGGHTLMLPHPCPVPSDGTYLRSSHIASDRPPCIVLYRISLWLSWFLLLHSKGHTYKCITESKCLPTWNNP